MVRVKPFAAIVLSLLAASCAVEELEIAHDAVGDGSRIVRTKSAPMVLTKRDSLRLLYEHQKREDVFVLKHLMGSKGNFYLDLSRNEAIAMGVSPEVYDFYSDFVDHLNNTQQ